MLSSLYKLAMVEKYFYTDIDVPSDGSCLFSSISVALNDSLSSISDIPSLSKRLRFLLLEYSKDCEVEPAKITPDFIRYMAAKYIDDTGLIMYNVEAEERKSKTFDNASELSSFIYNSKCWGDQSIIRSILKSFQYKLCLVIFDSEYGVPISMPREWTFRKQGYICLKLSGEHYNPIRIIRDDEEYKLCMTRKQLTGMISSYPEKVSNEY